MENLLVALIVGLALVYILRRLYRRIVKGERASCGCECSACNVSSQCRENTKQTEQRTRQS